MRNVARIDACVGESPLRCGKSKREGVLPVHPPPLRRRKSRRQLRVANVARIDRALPEYAPRQSCNAGLSFSKRCGHPFRRLILLDPMRRLNCADA
jgi:hypothetical protein